MKKGQGSAKGHESAAHAEEVYEIMMQTAKENLQSALDAWQSLVRADNLSTAFEVNNHYINETTTRNVEACRKICEMSMNGTKNYCEPFMQNMKNSCEPFMGHIKDMFEKFKVNPAM